MPGPNPPTRAGRQARTEEHAERRRAMREKLWTKVDYILDLIVVGCPKSCVEMHPHITGSPARDIKELTIAFGVLLDKYRLEAGDGRSGSGADIDDYLMWLAGESKPPAKAVHVRKLRKADKKVAAVVARTH